MKKFLLLIISILMMEGMVYAQTTVTLYSEAALDGYVWNYGGVLANHEVGTGDNQFNSYRRGFVSFDISSISAGVSIHSAILRLYPWSAGITPYNHLGNVIVDHLDYGSTLDAGDFNLASLHPDIGTLSFNSNIEWKTLDVTSSLQDDINNRRQRSQYRIRFSANETDNDNSSDDVNFESGENYGGTGNLPELVITYSILTVWKGTVSFPNKITSVFEEASGNIKFQKFMNTFTGTVELYTEENGFENGLVQNGEGCYVKFLGDDESTICIWEIASISTNVQGSKTDQLLLIGTGDMMILIGEDFFEGIAYLSAKGTLKKNSSAEVISVSLNGKIGGGSDLEFISEGSFRTTLTK